MAEVDPLAFLWRRGKAGAQVKHAVHAQAETNVKVRAACGAWIRATKASPRARTCQRCSWIATKYGWNEVQV